MKKISSLFLGIFLLLNVFACCHKPIMVQAKEFAAGTLSDSKLEAEFNTLSTAGIKDLAQHIDNDGNSFLHLLKMGQSSVIVSAMAKKVLDTIEAKQLGTTFNKLNFDNKQSWLYLAGNVYNFGISDGHLLIILAQKLQDLNDAAKRKIFKQMVVDIQENVSGKWLNDYATNNNNPMNKAIKPYCGIDVFGYPCAIPLLVGIDVASNLKFGFFKSGYNAPVVKEVWEFFLDHADKTRIAEFFQTPTSSLGHGIDPSGFNDGYVVHNLASANTAVIAATELLEKLLKKAQELGIDSKINNKIGAHATPLQYAATNPPMQALLIKYGAI